MKKLLVYVLFVTCWSYAQDYLRFTPAIGSKTTYETTLYSNLSVAPTSPRSLPNFSVYVYNPELASSATTKLNQTLEVVEQNKLVVENQLSLSFGDIACDATYAETYFYTANFFRLATNNFEDEALITLLTCITLETAFKHPDELELMQSKMILYLKQLRTFLKTNAFPLSFMVYQTPLEPGQTRVTEADGIKRSVTYIGLANGLYTFVLTSFTSHKNVGTQSSPITDMFGNIEIVTEKAWVDSGPALTLSYEYYSPQGTLVKQKLFFSDIQITQAVGTTKDLPYLSVFQALTYHSQMERWLQQ
jgi:hypothetical protein